MSGPKNTTEMLTALRPYGIKAVASTDMWMALQLLPAIRSLEARLRAANEARDLLSHAFAESTAVSNVNQIFAENDRLKAELERVKQEREPLAAVCRDIANIMHEYDRQMERRGYVDTPGGFEHLGDVWSQLRKWAHATKETLAEITAAEKEPK